MKYLFIALICTYTFASAQWQDTIEGNNLLTPYNLLPKNLIGLKFLLLSMLF